MDMNTMGLQSGITRAHPPFAHYVRSDFDMAVLVEEGIALQDQAGTRFAAVFLDYKGVPVDIALRVLLRPTERRKISLTTAPAPTFT